MAVNAACFTALVVLAGIAPGVLAVEVAGRINLGLMLCSALGVLTFCTSIAYDRRLARECDPEAEAIAEAITARQEQQAQQEQRAAAVAADPWGQQRWDAGQGRAAAADAWSQQRWDTGQGRAAAADAWSQQRWDTGQGRAEW